MDSALITKLLPADRVKNEIYATKLLKNIVPTHEPSETKDSVTDIKYTKIPGSELGFKQHLYATAGEWLKKIHGVHFDTAGTLANILSKKKSTWDTFFRAIYRSEIDKLSTLDNHHIILTDWLDQRTIREKYCLLHMDYSPKNIIATNKLQAVIDFEYSSSGDPLYDVAWAAMTFGNKKVGANWNPHIIKGYLGEKSNFSDTQINHLQTYKGAHLLRILTSDLDHKNQLWKDNIIEEIYNVTAK